MKRMVQLGSVLLAGIAITYLHPFELAMPWQSGRPGPLELTIQEIMAVDDYEFVDSEWGRVTPFNYVAMTGQFRATGSVSSTCSDLRLALDDWGRVSEITRRRDGCDIEARGPGPMTATIDVTEDPESQRALSIEVRVQHSS